MGKLLSGVTDAVGITDTKAADAASAASERYMQDVLRRLEDVDLPDIERQKLMLELPELIGEYAPELLGTSAKEGVSADQDRIDEQLRVINTLEDISEKGFTDTDEAELRAIQRGIASKARSSDQSLLENLAARGMAGGGQEMAMRQQAAQDALQQESAQGDRMIAQSQANRQNALTNLMNASSQRENTDYGRDIDKASARDSIAQANQQLSNQAQLYNLGQRQNVADRQTDSRNQQQMYNKGLIQQDLDNRFRKAGAAGSAVQNMAQQQAQKAANISAANQQTTSGLIQGGAMMMSDRNLKEDIKDGDRSIEAMLDKLEPFSYDYKEKTGYDDLEDHTSVMAQDLEKSELGSKFVEDTPEGKMVDYGKAAPSILAGQANLNKRLRKLEKLLKGGNDE